MKCTEEWAVNDIQIKDGFQAFIYLFRQQAILRPKILPILLGSYFPSVSALHFLAKDLLDLFVGQVVNLCYMMSSFD